MHCWDPEKGIITACIESNLSYHNSHLSWPWIHNVTHSTVIHTTASKWNQNTWKHPWAGTQPTYTYTDTYTAHCYALLWRQKRSGGGPCLVGWLPVSHPTESSLTMKTLWTSRHKAGCQGTLPNTIYLSFIHVYYIGFVVMALIMQMSLWRKKRLLAHYNFRVPSTL